MKKTSYYSFANGTLPPGCQMCVQGRKLVLFVTGLCPRSCYFCPLSEQKFHKDVMYANERPITELKEIIERTKITGPWTKACNKKNKFSSLYTHLTSRRKRPICKGIIRGLFHKRKEKGSI